MSFDENTCPIWGSEFKAQVRQSEHHDETIVDCARCGGEYRIDGLANVSCLNRDEKARLTTWLVDQRAQGNVCPMVDAEAITLIKNRPHLPVHDRANRMLRFIAEETEVVGTTYSFQSEIDPGIYAWSESTTEEEIGYFVDYLIYRNWLDPGHRPAMRGLGDYRIPMTVKVTVDGRSHIEEEKVNVDSAQGFIAMWFDDSMEEASKNGIELAIADAGFSPLRIDRKLDVYKIDDEIVSEIRRSRFLVADCTHGETKSRGSVYWEAGFAYGLGIEVIYTCREDMVKDLPFDTRQYPHIIWKSPADLCRQLKDRISARLGDGPGRQNTY